MELIDKQEAINMILGLPPERHYPVWYAGQIRQLPSAQPDIVRCKDCKYWKRSSYCEGYCGEIDMEGFDEDHYCGFAERREE